MNKVLTRYNNSFINYNAKVPDPLDYYEQDRLESKCLNRSLFTREDVGAFNPECNYRLSITSHRFIIFRPIHYNIRTMGTFPIIDRSDIHAVMLNNGKGCQPIIKNCSDLY